MAKWMPMITGALKEGAQKLMSIFTSKTEEPKDVAELLEARPDPDAAQGGGPDDRILTQPREIETPEGTFDSDLTENLNSPGSAKSTRHPSSTPVGPPSQPDPNSDRMKKEIKDYAEEDRRAQSSSWAESQEDQKPVKDSEEESFKVPEWPKAVMGVGGAAPSSDFGSSGNFAQQPSVSTQSASPPDQSATTPGQPQGMMANEQVAGGYSRTERLLELMMLRGIPSLKPPRGP